MENSNGETNFPCKLFLTNAKFSKVCKDFANGSSANVKIFTLQLSKILQLGGFLFGPPNIFSSPIK